MSKYYLDCPFSEKDDAKGLGAQWDSDAKLWFVPPVHYANMHQFNRWYPNQRLYLDCPYSDKDEAKEAGAKWDPDVRAWHVAAATKSLVKFRKWLPETEQPEAIVVSSAPKPHQKPSPSVKRRGNAQEAATLRVSDSMTVAQLQDEFRHRGLTGGVSGKSKTWLLEQLGVGSVWQTMTSKSPPKKKAKTEQASAVKSKKEAKPTPVKKAEKKATPLAKATPTAKAVAKATPTAKAAKGTPTAKAAATGPKTSTKKEPAATKPATTTNKPKPIDLDRLPRITSDLTISQLSHELLHRQPNMKGISNKPKTWFLEQLGVNSIWTTSADIQQDLSNLPIVTPSLTMAQLTHEFLARNKTATGLSTKNKTDLLKLVGLNSVWATGVETKEPKQAPKKPPVAPKPVAVKPTKSTTAKKAAASPKKKANATKKRPDPPVSSVSHTIVAPTNITSTSVMSCSFSTTSVVSDRQENQAGSMKAPSPNAMVPTAARAAPVPTKTKATKTKPKAPRPSVKSEEGPPPGIVSSDVIRSSELVFLKRPAQAAAAKSNPKSMPMPVVSSSMAPVESQSKAAPKSAKLNKGDTTIPVVSSTMTVAQLREELQAREPRLTGLSGKKKDWFLAQLPIGSQLQSSAEYKVAQAAKLAQLRAKEDAEAAKLHIHSSRCHHHPLADASLLRAPRSRHVKRCQTGICDVEHRFWCKGRPHRSCEQCDWDICEACFAIESLPTEAERQREIRRGLDNIAAKEQALQRQWELQRQLDEQRQKKYDQEREQERMEQHGEHLRKFPAHIRKPPAANKNQSKKLKYTVWTKDCHRKQSFSDVEREFDSSFVTLKEANLRVEYAFYYDNPWGCDKDEMYADEDKELQGGLRYMRCDPDGGGSFAISVLPSDAFDILQPDLADSGRHFQDSYSTSASAKMPELRKKGSFSKNIRNPNAANLNRNKKLKYTIWTSCGYDNDGWHRYGGPPDKEFNSSYEKLEEANERAEYVFLYDNPWGLEDEYEINLPETDTVSTKGCRFLECRPDDSERWTVSVIPSSAFDYVNT